MENIKVGSKVSFKNNAGEKFEGIVSYIDNTTYSIPMVSIEIGNNIEVVKSVSSLTIIK